MNTQANALEREALDKIRQARSNMILEHAFFGSLIMRLRGVADPTCKTLWTNGVELGFNPPYVLELPMLELQAGLAHEVLHVANGHTWRRDARDADRWNRAADYAINPILRDAGFHVPREWLLEERYKGLSVEAIYEQLPRASGGGQGGGNSANSNSGGGPGQRQGGSQPSGANAPDAQDPGDSSPGEVRDLPDSDKADEVEADWKVALKQAARAAKQRGALPSGLEWLVEDATRSRTDWRSILHRFVQQAARADYDWRMPNPRFMHMGLYLPSLRSEEMGPMVIGVDTSGSTGNWMSVFFAELKSAVEAGRPERVHVVYVDATVQRIDEYGPDDEMVLAPKGGGGTDFRPFFDWIEERDIKPACAVYLTDLAGAFPEVAPDYPVLWACPEEGTAPFGGVVRVEL